MPTYDYECTVCASVQELMHRINEEPEVACEDCCSPCKRVILVAPATVVPPHMQSAPDKMKYYGVTNVATGEGITQDTDVRQPPGITAKPIKGTTSKPIKGTGSTNLKGDK